MSQFIIFQPILGSVALQASIFWRYSSVISLRASQYLPCLWQIDQVSSGHTSHILQHIFLIVSAFHYFPSSDVSYGIDDCLTDICANRGVEI